jgi:hypothetical protein
MRRITICILLLLLAGCLTSPAPSIAPTAAPSAASRPTTVPSSLTPTQAIPTWTPVPTIPRVPPSPTAPPPVTIALGPGAPTPLVEALEGLVVARPAEFAWGELGTADVTAGFDPSLPLGVWVFAAVAPFPTVLDDVTYADLLSAWNGATSEHFAGRPLLLASETAAMLESSLGNGPVGAQLVEAADLLEAAWGVRPAWAIVPFEKLEPRWKVLRVDGLSPLDKPLDLAAYPLALPVGLSGQLEEAEKVWAALGGAAAGITNRDESLMTVLAMTGVTALVRATAFEMETRGLTYPGEEVVGVLGTADIAHVSNEVAFAADCPYPSPARQEGNLRFCSDDRYIELLEYVGVDVVELTGNHVNDWGTAAFSRTLTMYEERDWMIFGGGANALEAARPLTVTHNGNAIGFLGCNPAGPQAAWATDDGPGSAYCTVESLAEDIVALRPSVDVVVVGIQYHEYYTYAPTAQQQLDMTALAAAGADIVSGSQGHHVQGFAFPEGRLVHFGVGNLFFDQMDQLGTRQMFIDRHIIYAGRHIATDLWSGLIENWARPRAMTAAERATLLQSVFAASGW